MISFVFTLLIYLFKVSSLNATKLNCECIANESPSGGRIIGGQSVDHIGAFPWQVEQK